VTVSFATRAKTNMAPWDTGPVVAGKTDLDRYLNALGVMFQAVLELAEEEGSDGEAGYVAAWGKLMSPALCPFKYLGYLGMYVGVSIPAGATEAEARAIVEEHAGFSRGTREALNQAIERVIGTKVFTIRERTGPLGEANAYYFILIVGTGKATQALYNAINEVIPAGIWYTITEATDAWLSGTKAWDEISAGRKWTELTEGTF